MTADGLDRFGRHRKDAPLPRAGQPGAACGHDHCGKAGGKGCGGLCRLGQTRNGGCAQHFSLDRVHDQNVDQGGHLGGQGAKGGGVQQGRDAPDAGLLGGGKVGGIGDFALQDRRTTSRHNAGS